VNRLDATRERQRRMVSSMLLLCLTFSNEKKVEIIFYTKTLNVPKAEVSALCEIHNRKERAFKLRRRRGRRVCLLETQKLVDTYTTLLFAYLF
jgi:hypothetical protein